jgi:membrane fusion protein, multidrug efflux system
MKPPTTLERHPSEPKETGSRLPKIAPGHLPEIDLDEETPSSNYWWVWLLIFAAIGFGCYKLYQYETAKKAAIGLRKGAMRPRSISVVAEKTRRGDMPVYLQGLGNVTAFNTVTVKTRIDGQLINVCSRKANSFIRAACWQKSIRARIK